jgi:hypothetical protein
LYHYQRGFVKTPLLLLSQRNDWIDLGRPSRGQITAFIFGDGFCISTRAAACLGAWLCSAAMPKMASKAVINDRLVVIIE